MKHCTVCGAEAREGAKFCTSCGARLQSTVAASETATLPTVSDEPESPPENTPASGIADTSERDADNDPEDTAIYVPERDDSAEASAPADTPYVASWPDTDTPDDADEQPDQPEPASSSPESSEPASWTSAFVSPEPSPSDSGADDTGATAAEGDRGDDTSEWSWNTPQEDGDTDSDQGEAVVAEESWSWSTADEPASDTGAENDDVPQASSLEDETHGASTWESWAPAAGGPSALDDHDDDPIGQIRGLLNDLAERIDRVVSPALLDSRDVNPDDLADQLDRWARPVPDTDELLAVVQDARKSPRDLDAVARLADRAAELELLVRHYQSITSSSGKWADELRRSRSNESNESSF